MMAAVVTRVRESQIVQGIGRGIGYGSLFALEGIKNVAATVLYGCAVVEALKVMGVNMQGKVDLCVGGESLLHREGYETGIAGVVAGAIAMTAHWTSLQIQTRLASGKVKEV